MVLLLALSAIVALLVWFLSIGLLGIVPLFVWFLLIAFSGRVPLFGWLQSAHLQYFSSKPQAHFTYIAFLQKHEQVLPSKLFGGAQDMASDPFGQSHMQLVPFKIAGFSHVVAAEFLIAQTHWQVSEFQYDLPTHFSYFGQTQPHILLSKILPVGHCCGLHLHSQVTGSWV
jgi:hypothetical protein